MFIYYAFGNGQANPEPPWFRERICPPVKSVKNFVNMFFAMPSPVSLTDN